MHAAAAAAKSRQLCPALNKEQTQRQSLRP